MRHLKLSALTGAFCLLGVAVSFGWSAAATLTGMSVSTEGEVTRVHVMLDEPVEFSHFDLSDPARVFVDCLGVDTILPKKLPAGHGRAQTIEASVWKGAGYHALTRITIDLASASQVEVQKDENGLVVILGPAEETSWSPETLVGDMITEEADPPAEESVTTEEASHAETPAENIGSIDSAEGSDATETGNSTEENAEAAYDEAAEETPEVAYDEAAQETPEIVSDEAAEETAEVAAEELSSEETPSSDDSREDMEESSSEVAAFVEEVAPVEDSSETDSDQTADGSAYEISSQDIEPVFATEELTAAEASAQELTPAEEDLDYSLPDEVEPEPYYYQRTEPAVTEITMHKKSGLAGRSGARVSLDIQGADIYSVLRSISEYSGVNIVMGYDVPTEVKEPLSYHLENVPWGEALEIVLRSAHLWYREEGNVIRVDTEENLRNEELARTGAARQLEAVMPLETRIVEVIYANAAELKPTIQKSLSRRGVIEVDNRTNSLLVTDIGPRVQAAVDMIRHLDSETPQIEIVAKMVDVDARFIQELGVLWTGNNTSGDVTITGPAPPFDPVTGEGTNALLGANDLLNPAAAVKFGLVRSWGAVSALLSAMEQDNKANIISNPRITTVNNRTARILVGKKIPLIVLDEAGNAVTELVTIGITLLVTPHINDNNRITLDLHPEVSDLAAQATVQGGVIINTSEADTRVMVENGETVVIGGLIRANETVLVRGVPILKDIPLLGSFFRNSTKVTEKRELLIFVTPRILNASE